MKGNNTARAELYKAYSPRLMALCCRYASQREQAEDLLHDAFLQIFDQMRLFHWKGDGSLRAWMERVTVHVAIDCLRRDQAFTLVPLDEATVALTAVGDDDDEARGLLTDAGDVEDAPTADDIYSMSEEELVRLIGELPEGYRAVFNLFCIDGFSHKEIARMLGIKENSSSSQLARAKALLAKKIIGMKRAEKEIVRMKKC